MSQKRVQQEFVVPSGLCDVGRRSGESLAVTLMLARINGFGGAVGPCRALPPAMLREHLRRRPVGAALLTYLVAMHPNSSKP